MSNARERALLLLAVQRGLVDPAAAQRLDPRAAGGSVLGSLVQSRTIQAADAQRLLESLPDARFRCAACGLTAGWEQLQRAPRLDCPRCGRGLALAARATGHASPAVKPWPEVANSLASGAGFVAVPLPSAPSSPPSAPAPSSPSAPAPSSPSAPAPSSWAAPPASGRLPALGGRAPRTLGPYALSDELGRGSNGVVFLAKRAGLERRFAVKLLTVHDADEETIARFRLEAAVASKLDHRGVIGVFDVGREGDQLYYYVMEYCPGPTLQAHLRERGRLPVDEAARLIAQVARTVHYAHEREVIHRDLKPANVILEEGSGRPRITDFGLARDRSLARSLTRSGDVLGTPYYMAPEQLRGGDVDLRLDVYALGVILYQCLTGRLPYQAATTVELAEQIHRGQPVPPSQLVPELPPSLEAICLCAMAPSRDDRYLSAEALAEDLERFERGDSPSHISGIGLTPRARRRWPALLGAALSLGAGLLAAEAWRRSARVERGARSEGSGERALDMAPEAVANGASRVRHLLERAERLSRARVPADEALAAFDAALAAAGAGETSEEARRVVLARAAFLIRRGRWAEAAAAAGTALGAPGALGHEALRLRAHALEASGERVQAARAYEELARSDLLGARGLVGGAAAARLAEDAARGRGLAEQALALEPDYVPALIEAAMHALTLGDEEDALRRVERGLSLQPDEPRLLFLDALMECQLFVHAGSARNGARARPSRERAARALGRVQEAIDLTAPHVEPGSLVLRGALRLELGELDAAIADLDVVLGAAPQHGSALLLRGKAYWRKGLAAWDQVEWKERAEEEWRRARQAGPAAFDGELAHSSTSPAMVATIQAAAGAAVGEAWLLERARPGWLAPGTVKRLEARAAKAQAQAREPLRALLLAAARAEPWSAVEPLWDEAERVAGECLVTTLELARVAVGREAYERSARAMTRARELGAAGARGLELELLEARHRFNLGKRHEATPLLEELARRDPEGEVGEYARAWYFDIHERMADALRLAERAADRHPEHALTQVELARLVAYEDKTRVEEALALTRRALLLEGAIDLHTVLGRASLLEDRGLYDEQGEMRPLHLAKQGLEDAFAAYREAFTLTPGPSALLFAAMIGVETPPDLGFFHEVDDWIDEAIRRDPERGLSYELRGYYELLDGAPKAQVLGWWRKAREVEPRLLFAKWHLDRFEQAYGAGPELDELRERAWDPAAVPAEPARDED